MRTGAIQFGVFIVLIAAASTLLTVAPTNASSKFNGFSPTPSQLQDLVARSGGNSPFTLAGAATAEDPRQGRAVSSPRVLPPQSNPYGHSYGDWSVKWWQWAYSLPVSGHPLFDESGADCAAGQSGPVWFLGGVFNVSGSATRDLCTVPSGKALFFPILNVEWDNICPPVDPPMSVAELAATSAWYMSLATDLECDVDGVQVGNLSAYRVTADAFSVSVPPGSLWDLFCGTPAGSYSPLLPDGIYLMLAPLSVGPHTIHFRGTVADPVNFTLEITYHLTVAPHGRFEPDNMTAGQAGDANDDAVPAARHTSWGRVKAFYH